MTAVTAPRDGRPSTGPAVSQGGERPSPVLLAVVAVVGVLFSAPFVYVLWRNLELGTDLGAVVWDADTLHPLRRSLWLGGTVAVSSAIVGTALAWLTIRTDLPGRRLWRIIAPLPLVFPSFVGATALLAGFATGGLLEQVLAPLGVDALPDIRGFRGAWLVSVSYTHLTLPTICSV